MPPLKIALFSDSALPVLNGVGVSIDALVRSLRERGHSVFLYTSWYKGFRDSDPNVTRFPSIRLPFTSDYPLAVPPFYPWFPEFKRRRFDLVHTHTPFTVGFVGLRWAQSCEIPIVSTYHTHYDKYAHYVPLFPQRYLRYKVAKHTHFYYNAVDHVLTPSLASARWLRRHSVRRPITVVPTGVPDPRPLDRAGLRREFGLSENRRVLLYTGRLAVEKNLGVILDAAASVFASVPDSELWVVGEGPARGEFQTQARELGIGDRVRFWGAFPRHEVDRFYAAADVFLFASLTETQGLVITEAMTYGLPAVVVQGGGASAAVANGRTGFVVPNDPEELARQVLALLRDPRLYDSLSTAAEQAARALTVSAMTDQVLRVYGRVMAPQPTPEGSFVI